MTTSTYTQTKTYRRAHVCVREIVCVYMRECVREGVRVAVRVQVSVCACVYQCVCVCVYVCVKVTCSVFLDWDTLHSP